MYIYPHPILSQMDTTLGPPGSGTVLRISMAWNGLAMERPATFDTAND